jgi:hypothetical protein
MRLGNRAHLQFSECQQSLGKGATI